MTESKKISFGFSKLSKKPTSFSKPQEKKVELIDCLEGQSIKIKDVVEEEIKPLVIPMGSSGLDVLHRVREVNKLKGRIMDKQLAELDERPDSELTLDELAARQLIKEASQTAVSTKTTKVDILPVEDLLHLEQGAPESTIDDYENVPIEDYGLAMLRGMGWAENTGIGKRNRSAAVAVPELRPKGMGLGADKMIKVDNGQKAAVDKDGNELKLLKGAYAKIIAGKEKGNFCVVQGLDDEAGRVIVKTTLKADVLSLNEFMLTPVTKDEYLKSSKVLNNAKYEEYIKSSEIKTEVKKERQEKNSNHNHNNQRSINISDSENEDNYKSRKKLKNYKSKQKSNDVYEISSDSETEERIKNHKNTKKEQNLNSDDSSDLVEKRNKKSKKKSKKESRNRSRSPARKKRSKSSKNQIDDSSDDNRRKTSKSNKNHKDESSDDQSPSRRNRSTSSKNHKYDSSDDSSTRRKTSKSSKKRDDSRSPQRRKSSYKNHDSSDDSDRRSKSYNRNKTKRSSKKYESSCEDDSDNGRSKSHNDRNKTKKSSKKYKSSSEDDYKKDGKYKSSKDGHKSRKTNYHENR